MTDFFLSRHDSDVLGAEILDIEFTCEAGFGGSYYEPPDPTEIVVTDGYVVVAYDEAGDPAETRPLTVEEREALAFDDANFCEAAEIAASEEASRRAHYDYYDESPIY